MLKRIILGAFVLWVAVVQLWAGSLSVALAQRGGPGIAPGFEGAWAPQSAGQAASPASVAAETGATAGDTAVKSGLRANLTRWFGNAAARVGYTGVGGSGAAAGAAVTLAAASTYVAYSNINQAWTETGLPCIERNKQSLFVTNAEERKGAKLLMSVPDFGLIQDPDSPDDLLVGWDPPKIITMNNASSEKGKATLVYRGWGWTNFPEAPPKGVNIPESPASTGQAYTEVEFSEIKLIMEITPEGGTPTYKTIPVPTVGYSQYTYRLPFSRFLSEDLRTSSKPVKVTMAAAALWVPFRATAYTQFSGLPGVGGCAWSAYNRGYEHQITLAGPAVTFTVKGNTVTQAENSDYEPTITSAEAEVDEEKNGSATLIWSEPAKVPDGTPNYQLKTVRIEETTTEAGGAGKAVGTYQDIAKTNLVSPPTSLDSKGNFQARKAKVVLFKNLNLQDGESQRIGVAVKANFDESKHQINNADTGYSKVKEIVFTRNGDTYSAEVGRELDRPEGTDVEQPVGGGGGSGAGLTDPDCDKYPTPPYSYVMKIVLETACGILKGINDALATAAKELSNTLMKAIYEI
ncbi:hypothetical protein HY374_03585 [Candidatus Berkelbacteria bacterium]|nr:hypothetical protein [Candidatus Berkelbacteria bacterium]